VVVFETNKAIPPKTELLCFYFAHGDLGLRSSLPPQLGRSDALASGWFRPQIDFINLQDGLQSQPDCFRVNVKQSKFTQVHFVTLLMF